MREFITMVTAFIAIIIFIIAVASSFLMTPGSDISDSIGETELKNSSVTGAKVADGSLTDLDITNRGISKIANDAITSDNIAKNSINMEHFSSAVLNALEGLTNLTMVSLDDVVANSIDGSLLADGSITDSKISDFGISKIADSCISSDQIMDGSIQLEDLSSSIVDMLSSIGIGSDGVVDDDLVINGEITVDRVLYSSPRTHYFSVGGEHFQPWSTTDYASGGGCGGAYLISGSGTLVAPVNLPNGAVVTSFKVFFYDVSSEDMTVYLYAQNLNTCSYGELARVQSDSTSGYYNKSDSTIDTTLRVINNRQYAYHIKAYSDSWSSSLKVKGAVIRYTIDEAQ